MNVPRLGLDIGSTTVKAIVLAADSDAVLFSAYRRHGAKQVETAGTMLAEIAAQLNISQVNLAVCGSGGKAVAEALGAHFVQEVLANSIAVRQRYPQVRTAIELGGQDAKVIFFHRDPDTGQLIASDMRMNGSCAGGTGAFIDEVASILHIAVEDFDTVAKAGTHVFDISGRCGVFAKTDIQPLLNQGVPKSDIALSTLHAIAKQTIGGLAQGLEIHGPVIFEGGPLTFNPSLVKVFAERLGLNTQGVIVPTDSETFVALGTALALDSALFAAPALVELHQAQGRLTAYHRQQSQAIRLETRPFFTNAQEESDFYHRHQSPPPPQIRAGDRRIYVGLDGGSTTSKCVALAEDGRLLGSWYKHNQGRPIEIMTGLLQEMYRSFQAQGIEPEVLGLGTTGYAELLFATAFKADFHTVETVSHAKAAIHFVPGASFVLDIGGQDMKAIMIQNDIVTGIVLNEACSAGCGSFLENFASSLNIPVQQIAQRAFASRKPSVLGSRCTVFMNSSIITEQKNGMGPDDIMAGLCRSIIENVFTKVMRVSNFDALGAIAVVQGGTFKNDAVLRAVEQYTKRTVVRAPWPGEMGALGIALLCKEHQERLYADNPQAMLSRFPGFATLANFSYSQETGQVCDLCTNYCNRTVIRFADGSAHVSGNRCERGEQVHGTRSKQASSDRIQRKGAAKVANLFHERNQLWFAEPPILPLHPARDIRIGIPRVLEFYQSFPFWNTLFQALGFQVVLSDASTQKLFQSGLANVPSDTVCFPAKIAHGHIRNLVAKKVDRIFMPMLNRMPPENPSAKGNQVCAVVKGYPLVLDYSDEPFKRHGIIFDHPMFHWFQKSDRDTQICLWFESTFAIAPALLKKAIEQADRHVQTITTQLENRGKAIIDALGLPDGPEFAVVLAGRPYHTDTLVNHDLPAYFMQQGIPVLSLDALAGLHEVDLSPTRAEPTNAYHVRMFAAAMIAARHPALELVQIVSFGCGHDAIISDEVTRLMHKISGKVPLILKLDESDVKGPLAIRVRSFVETVRARRRNGAYTVIDLPDPFPLKFQKRDVTEKVILVPNVTPAWTKMISAAMRSEGYRVEAMPLANRQAIALGKQYVHNDMCYPAQVNIGEMLGALQSGKFKPSQVVCGMGKTHCDCRLAHYAALARKALDEAGYADVPIITTDNVDAKNIHPAFRLGLRFQIRAMWGNTIIDVLEHTQRRLRPYELIPGQTAEIFQEAVDRISDALSHSIKQAVAEYDAALVRFLAMPARLEQRKPRVFIIGEYLLNFHDPSNMEIVAYLEKAGMEVIIPDTFMLHHRDFLKKDSERRYFKVHYPMMDVFANSVSLALIDRVKRIIHGKAKRLPFLDEAVEIREFAASTDHLMHHTFTPGEGWLITAEILHQAALGVDSFVVLQPFGCIPNHVVGRGMMKKIKEICPEIQIVALDFDPDTSFANIENRLQMLVMNARQMAEKRRSK